MTTSDQQEIEKLKTSGRILAETLSLVISKVEPGVSAYELDKLAEENILKHGAIPAFKNYRSRKNDPAFPASLCVSVNDEVVHGIPTKDKVLQEVYIVRLDLGVNYQGFFTDSAVTVGVGKVSEKYRQLMQTTKKALD